MGAASMRDASMHAAGAASMHACARPEASYVCTGMQPELRKCKRMLCM